MGGKRPDQHNIDPAEGSSSNHTWRGEGRSGDERIENEQKQRLSAKDHDQPMIPEAGTNPALREHQERKGAAKRDENRSDRASSSEEDDRIDEAGEESFPASDPPAY